MPVAEFEENNLRVISVEDHKGLHKTFRSQKLNFSEKFFKLVDKTQFEALLQTQVAEVGCNSTRGNSANSYLFLVAEFRVF